MDDKAKLQYLYDKSEILDLITRFARAVDRIDYEEILSVYHPDGWDDHGVFAGTPKDFADWVVDLHANQFLWTVHYCSNSLLEIEGDKATGETHVWGQFRYQVDGKLYDMTGCGRYLDRFEKRNGVWKIAYRTATADWNRIDTVDEVPQGELVKKLRTGTRDKSDISYEFIRRDRRAQ